jgi:hypothetical protein
VEDNLESSSPNAIGNAATGAMRTLHFQDEDCTGTKRPGGVMVNILDLLILGSDEDKAIPGKT